MFDCRFDAKDEEGEEEGRVSRRPSLPSELIDRGSARREREGEKEERSVPQNV